MDGRGTVDRAAFSTMIGRLVAAGVDSVGVLGSTGSYAYLPRGLRRDLTDQAVAAAGSIPVAVGVGAPALSDVLENAQDAAAAGAAALLLAPVSYQPLRDEEVFALFRIVAAEADLPVILYNNPGTTGVTFSADLIARIAALPGVIAVKMPPRADPAGEISTLRKALPDHVALGYSGDAMIAAALAAGAEVWFSVLAGLFPEPCRAMVDAARAGDREGLAALDARLAPIWRVFAASSSYRVMHCAAGLVGYGDPRPPLPVLPLKDDERAAVRAALIEAGLLE
jgi:4-hydroxy-tetrahydrodipicolinate synthase